MSWITQLCETYENLKTNDALLRGCKMPLVPVSHTVQTAHVEIFIDEDGNFIRAEGIPKEKSLTVVPCTEDSASKCSGNTPHALYDNLKYIAGNQTEYTGNEKTSEYYQKYIEQLMDWCEYESCPSIVKSIYKYVSKGNVINDLIAAAVLNEDDKGLTKQWGGDRDNKPAQMINTFVRFRVENSDGISVECNADKELKDAYTKYDRSRREKFGMCFVTGERMPVTYKHSSKIRYSSDKAKLISANDTGEVILIGRFNNPEDAFAVGYEVSDKAHSALRWIIANQGFTIGNQTVAVWSVKANKIPYVFGDTLSIFPNQMDIYNKYTPLDSYSESLRRAINGYKHSDLKKPLENNNVVIMIVEAATTGRLSIRYYREMQPSEYLDNIENWHELCIWNHNYKIVKTEIEQEDGSKKEVINRIKFTGAPSINDIIFASYGEIADKLKKHLTEILVLCICDRKKIPYDIVMKAFIRASDIFRARDYEDNKVISIACALIKKYYHDRYEEEYDMALDYENKERSYLFGRVLAYAERIENYALYKVEKKRVPNARKLRGKYRVQPAKTLVILDEKLEPYVERLYVSNNWLYTQMQEVISLINERDYMNNKPLEPSFLLGYACQMTELLKKKEEADESKEEI